MSSTSAPSRRATQRGITLRGVAMAALLGLSLHGLAQARPELLDAAEREWLRVHGPLRYAPHLDAPPFEQVRAEDVASGIVPELLDLVALNLGTPIRTGRFARWTEGPQAQRKSQLTGGDHRSQGEVTIGHGYILLMRVAFAPSPACGRGLGRGQNDLPSPPAPLP